jgi:hypothetical protein
LDVRKLSSLNPPHIRTYWRQWDEYIADNVDAGGADSQRRKDVAWFTGFWIDLLA